MNEKQMKEIMQEAVNKYGEKQLDIAQEELAELIQAISKYKRAITHEEREKALMNLVEEIADVGIMINQIGILLKIYDDNIRGITEFKLKRLKGRMDEEDEKAK